MNTVEIVGLILGSSAGSSVITAVFSKILNAKRDKFEIEKVVQEVYGGLIQTMKSQIENLKKEVVELSNVVTSYKEQETAWVQKRQSMIKQIRELESKNRSLSNRVRILSVDNGKYKKQQHEMEVEIEILKTQINNLKPHKS